MRDYAKVGPQFWIGATGRKIKAAGSDAVVLALYLITSPHSNMLGLYYLPLLYVAHETGLGPDKAAAAMAACVKADFCGYDPETEMVWVKEMAAYQIADFLKPDDRRCKGVQNDYEALPENPFLGPFFDKYHAAFSIPHRRGLIEQTRPFEAPSKPLRSQEQEQEQEQEHIPSDKSDGRGKPAQPRPQPPDDDPKREFYNIGKQYLGPKASGALSKFWHAIDQPHEALALLRQTKADIPPEDGMKYLMGIVHSRERDRAGNGELNLRDTGDAW